MTAPVDNLPEVSRQKAEELSRSKLVPEHFYKNPANMQYAMEIGHELGLKPVSALRHIHVFPNKKTGMLQSGLSAHLMVTLARKAGHDVNISGNATMATAVLVRGDATPERLKRYQLMREEERRQKLALVEDTERLYGMRRQQILDRISDLKQLESLGEDVKEEVAGVRKELASLHSSLGLDELKKKLVESSFDISKMARFESTWTAARVAQIPELANKTTWTSYRPEMLKRAASRDVVRDGAVEVIIGLREMMAEMGVEFTGGADEEIAFDTALYDPEELGVETDEDGVPVHKNPSVKEKKLEAARRLVASTDAAGVLDHAQRIVRDDTLPFTERTSRLQAIDLACEEAGILQEEVQGDEGPTSLEHSLNTLLTH